MDENKDNFAQTVFIVVICLIILVVLVPFLNKYFECKRAGGVYARPVLTLKYVCINKEKENVISTTRLRISSTN
jgi:hypothetical protein